jgi:putative DNA methylase
MTNLSLSYAKLFSWVGSGATRRGECGLRFPRFIMHTDQQTLQLEPSPPPVLALAKAGTLTLLENGLPYKELSLLAKADRRASDPVYAAHRWWARRPPAVFRGVLLAAALPPNTSTSDYWSAFASTGTPLQGLKVDDAFAGGGTTLVEAARLGANVHGSDVDPLAVNIVRHELAPPSSQILSEIGQRLLTELETKAAWLFASTDSAWIPLHYFYLHQVTCPSCRAVGLLYRNLILARGSKKDGAVKRNADVVAFCPECRDVKELFGASRQELHCCGRHYRLDVGTYRRQKYNCSECGERASHRDLKTGVAPRLLLAIEETGPDKSRRIRGAGPADVAIAESAMVYLARHRAQMDLPKRRLSRKRRDPRPISFGIDRVDQLFTDRQLAVFGLGFKWIRTHKMKATVRRALNLAMSNALSTNNRLCSYATEYGRLAPLFSIRSYAIPALPVELNPFHPWAGRGTLRRSLKHLVDSCEGEVRRHVWSIDANRAVPKKMDFARHSIQSRVVCRSASDADSKMDIVDFCVFDPPYFDYISYSELSEFYRSWYCTARLGGDPLLPESENPTETFGRELGRCLRSMVKHLAIGRPVVFTYHASASDSWKAVGIAIDDAGLCVTALWPVWNDSHMGHHASSGNCEWDVIVVCRRLGECRVGAVIPKLESWEDHLAPLSLGAADRQNLQYALDIARPRWRVPLIGDGRSIGEDAQ